MTTKMKKFLLFFGVVFLAGILLGIFLSDCTQPRPPWRNDVRAVGDIVPEGRISEIRIYRTDVPLGLGARDFWKWVKSTVTADYLRGILFYYFQVIWWWWAYAIFDIALASWYYRRQD